MATSTLTRRPRSQTQTAARTMRLRLQSRDWLLLSGVVGTVMALLIIVQSLNTYDVAYRFFQNVALDSRAKIQDSDAALQSIAQVSTRVVDSVISASSTSDTDAAQAIYDAFDQFRRDMFRVNSNLETGPETDAFYKAEGAVYNEFWPTITAMMAAQKRGDQTAVIQAYSAADEVLEHTIIPNLTQVEEYNFAAMQRTEREANAAIFPQALVMLLLAVGLAVLITGLSFWLRLKVRRYLTPALDAAAILAWLLALGLLIDMLHTPGQLKSLVEDSYYSVSATQRIIAIAMQTNRTESAEILDYPNAAKWQAVFDANDTLIQEALCGYQGCVQIPFTRLHPDAIDPEVVTQANLKLPHVGVEVLKVVPLVANVTYMGEPQAIEQARQAYVRYLAYDQQIRDLVASNQLEAATVLDLGDSNVAFGQFIDAVKSEKQINTDWFDRVWQQVQDSLPAHRLLFGMVGYMAVIGLLGLGVYHRYREL